MSDWFNHVTAATTATDGPAGNGNIPTSAPGITSIDGVTLGPKDRILLKNQTKPSENGTYTYQGSGNPLGSSGDTLAPEAVVRVDQATVNAKTEWWLKDTTNYVWTKAWASTADAIYYVSSSAYADDAFDGLSHGTAHRPLHMHCRRSGRTPASFSYLVHRSALHSRPQSAVSRSPRAKD